MLYTGSKSELFFHSHFFHHPVSFFSAYFDRRVTWKAECRLSLTSDKRSYDECSIKCWLTWFKSSPITGQGLGRGMDEKGLCLTCFETKPQKPNGMGFCHSTQSPVFPFHLVKFSK